MERYHHGNLKAALLKAAAQMVGKLGTAGLTLREVARKAGVSHNAPYRHFKSREELLAALAAESFLKLHGALEKASAEGSAVERLVAACQGYLRFAMDSPSRFELMFHSGIEWKDYPECAAAYGKCFALLAELLRAQPKLKADVETAGDLVWAAAHGVADLGVSKRLRHGKIADLEPLLDQAVRTVLAGLAR